MERKTLLIIISPFLFFLVVVSLVLQNHPTKQNQVCFKNYCFDVELAVTPEEQSRGLMFRERLDSNKGMLFVFEKEEAYSFWMENTLIPLDIIWINGNKEIVFIGENAQPCRKDPCQAIEPSDKAKYVLEINGGISKEIGLIVGEKMSFEHQN